MEYGGITEKIKTTALLKAAVAVASVVVYLAAFFPVYHVVGGTAAALAIVVAVATGYAYGLYAGLAGGVAMFPLNVVLLYLMGESGWTLMSHEGLLGSLIVVVIGGMVGWLSDLYDALRESEVERAIVEHSHDGIFIYRGTEFLFVNDRATEITGYTEEELNAMNPFDLIHPDDRERVEDIGRRRAQGNDVPSTYQARVIRKDGAVRICEFAITAITYRAEYAALGTVRDITQQKKAEKQLRRSEREKTLILDTSPALIIYQDTDHRVEWANWAAAESIDERPEDLEGRRCHQVWHRREQPCEDCPIEQAMETKEMQETEMTTPDGRHWLVRGSPVMDEDGNVTGAVETVLDITERKQAEKEMERALEKEKVFKLKTAHHFFNPIAISKGYLDVAMDKLPDKHSEEIQKACDAIMRIQRVVENVVERGEIHE